jgi:hypothetical protein
VVRIVKTLRRYKMFAQAMLSQKHRLLLKFQRQNLIETTSSSSNSDNGAYDEMRMMENKNPLIRLVAYSKIKKMLRQFEGVQVNDLERNMMRGLFMRNIKDFAEETKKNSKKSLFERLKGGEMVEEGGSDLNDMSQMISHVKHRAASAISAMPKQLE